MAKTYTAAELAAMTDMELDDVVARVVMGWVVTPSGNSEHWTCCNKWVRDRFCFRPVRDWAETGKVIERMLNRGADMSLYFTAARIRPAPEMHSIYIQPAATTMRAICEAAVLATIQWRKARKGKR